jgi:CRISPR-associated protein Csy1
LRLARVQACAGGHPSTTGLPTIDAFVSCADMEPANAAGPYCERLLLLPGLGTRYPAPAIAAAATRASLGLPERRRLYLVPQSAFKLHPDNDSLLANIVAGDREAVLVLFADREMATTAFLRERVRGQLARITDRPDEHMAWLARRTREEYLAVNRACDVMVDSLHWSGGNTTLDALHCALPVVTCPGELMRGRQSAAMLRTLERPDLIASSPAQLAMRAIELATDPASRERMAGALIERLPALTQSSAPLEALDARLRELLGLMRV